MWTLSSQTSGISAHLTRVYAATCGWREVSTSATSSRTAREMAPWKASCAAAISTCALNAGSMCFRMLSSSSPLVCEQYSHVVTTAHTSSSSSSLRCTAGGSRPVEVGGSRGNRAHTAAAYEQSAARHTAWSCSRTVPVETGTHRLSARLITRKRSMDDLSTRVSFGPPFSSAPTRQLSAASTLATPSLADLSSSDTYVPMYAVNAEEMAPTKCHDDAGCAPPPPSLAPEAAPATPPVAGGVGAADAALEPVARPPAPTVAPSVAPTVSTCASAARAAAAAAAAAATKCPSALARLAACVP